MMDKIIEAPKTEQKEQIVLEMQLNRLGLWVVTVFIIFAIIFLILLMRQERKMDALEERVRLLKIDVNCLKTRTIELEQWAPEPNPEVLGYE
jgi:beta-lactamase regulating signal transducer with metallopeptidase domain